MEKTLQELLRMYGYCRKLLFDEFLVGNRPGGAGEDGDRHLYSQT